MRTLFLWLSTSTKASSIIKKKPFLFFFNFFIAIFAKSLEVEVSVAEVWEKGGAGAEDLAKKVAKAAEANTTQFKPQYQREDSIVSKIEALAKNIYGADGVDFSGKAKKDLRTISKLGLNHLPVCVAKTQKSLSDNAALLGRPRGFRITVREIEIAAGAGFVVPITGAMMRMPGLPATPSSENIDIDKDGNISGLF